MSSTTTFVRHMGQLDDKINGRNRGLSKQCSMNSMFQEHTCFQVIQKALPKVAKTIKGLLYQNKSCVGRTVWVGQFSSSLASSRALMIFTFPLSQPCGHNMAAAVPSARFRQDNLQGGAEFPPPSLVGRKISLRCSLKISSQLPLARTGSQSCCISYL